MTGLMGLIACVQSSRSVTLLFDFHSTAAAACRPKTHQIELSAEYYQLAYYARTGGLQSVSSNEFP